MSGKKRLLVVVLALGVPDQMTLAQDHLSVAPSAQANVSGIVTDEAKAPVRDAEVRLARPGGSVRLMRTESDGRFSFGNVGTGVVSIAVRRLGYVPRTLDLEISAASPSAPIVLILRALAEGITPVRVEARDSRLETFYAHRSRSAFGQFMDAAEIARRGPVYLSELFRTVPGASVRPSSRPGNIVRLRGCQPMIWLDGIRVPNAELDEVTNPMDISGIEIYSSWSALPGEYMDRGMGACGAIVVWTKSR